MITQAERENRRRRIASLVAITHLGDSEAEILLEKNNWDVDASAKEHLSSAVKRTKPTSYWPDAALRERTFCANLRGPVGIVPIVDYSVTTWRGSVYVSGGCPSLPQASAHTSLMRTADLPQASLFRLSVGASTTALAAEPMVPHKLRPPKLAGHSCVLHANRFYIFGGSAATSLYCFTLETGEWSIVKTYGTPPSPRAAHTAVVHRGSMYVFGGRSMSGAALDDLHRFDFDTMSWSVFRLSVAPTPRCYHTAIICGSEETAVQERAHVATQRLDPRPTSPARRTAQQQTHKLHSPREPGRFLSLTGEVLSPRSLRTATSTAALVQSPRERSVLLYERAQPQTDVCSAERLMRYRPVGGVGGSEGGCMLVFGGQNPRVPGAYYNDLWKFDFETAQWSQLHCNGVLPAPRAGHAVMKTDQFMYVYGGFADDGIVHSDRIYSDCCRLHLETVVWDRVATVGDVPQGRSRCSAAQIAERQWVVLFGCDLHCMLDSAVLFSFLDVPDEDELNPVGRIVRSDSPYSVSRSPSPVPALSSSPSALTIRVPRPSLPRSPASLSSPRSHVITPRATATPSSAALVASDRDVSPRVSLASPRGSLLSPRSALSTTSTRLQLIQRQVAQREKLASPDPRGSFVVIPPSATAVAPGTSAAALSPRAMSSLSSPRQAVSLPLLHRASTPQPMRLLPGAVEVASDQGDTVSDRNVFLTADDLSSRSPSRLSGSASPTRMQHGMSTLSLHTIRMAAAAASRPLPVLLPSGRSSVLELGNTLHATSRSASPSSPRAGARSPSPLRPRSPIDSPRAGRVSALSLRSPREAVAVSPRPSVPAAPYEVDNMRLAAAKNAAFAAVLQRTESMTRRV